MPKPHPRRPSKARLSRSARLAILTEFDRLLAKTADPLFCGSISVEIHAAGGQIGQKPKFTVTTYGTGGNFPFGDS